MYIYTANLELILHSIIGNYRNRIKLTEFPVKRLFTANLNMPKKFKKSCLPNLLIVQKSSVLRSRFVTLFLPMDIYLTLYRHLKN